MKHEEFMERIVKNAKALSKLSQEEPSFEDPSYDDMISNDAEFGTQDVAEDIFYRAEDAFMRAVQEGLGTISSPGPKAEVIENIIEYIRTAGHLSNVIDILERS